MRSPRCLVLLLVFGGCSLGADLGTYAGVEDTGVDVDAAQSHTPLARDADAHDAPDLRPDAPPDVPTMDTADAALDAGECRVAEDCDALVGTTATCDGGLCRYLCDGPHVDVDGDLEDGLEGTGCECRTVGLESCGNGADDNCDGRVDEDCCDLSRWTPLAAGTGVSEPTHPSVALAPDGSILIAWQVTGATPETEGLSSIRLVALAHDFEVRGIVTLAFGAKLVAPRVAATDTGFVLSYASTQAGTLVWDAVGTDATPSGTDPAAFPEGAALSLAHDIAWFSGEPMLAFVSSDVGTCGTGTCLAVARPDGTMSHKASPSLPADAVVRSLRLVARGDVLALVADIDPDTSQRSEVHWFTLAGDNMETSMGSFPVGELQGRTPAGAIAIGGEDPYVFRIREGAPPGLTFFTPSAPREEEVMTPGDPLGVWSVTLPRGTGALWFERDTGLFYTHVPVGLLRVTPRLLSNAAQGTEFDAAAGAAWGGFVAVSTAPEAVAIRAFDGDGLPACASLQ